jgi:isopentenyl-diphosphate delta-isomerase
VLIGITNDAPTLNLEEVEDFRYISEEELKKEIADAPHIFTEWFKIALPKLIVKY